jgi:hypothetical protein
VIESQESKRERQRGEARELREVMRGAGLWGWGRWRSGTRDGEPAGGRGDGWHAGAGDLGGACASAMQMAAGGSDVGERCVMP